MKNLTNLHKTVLRLIIQLQGSPFSTKSISQEKLISLLHFISDENVHPYGVIDDLVEQGLIQIHDPCSRMPSYIVTPVGGKVDEILEMPAGITVGYEELLLEEYTDESLKDDIEFVEMFFINWTGEFVHVLADRLYEYDDQIHEDLLHENLYFCFVASQGMIFEWLAPTLLRGSYEIVLRELRSILEGLFLSYSIENTSYGLSLDEKFAKMKQLEDNNSSHGKKVFTMSKIDGWEDHYAFYKDLCKYVHSSMAVAGRKMMEIADEGFPDVKDISFDREAFQYCVTSWKRVATTALQLNSLLFRKYHIEFEILPAIFGVETYRPFNR